MRTPLRFRLVTLDDLIIDDRSPLTAIAIYGRLEALLKGSAHRFLIPEDGRTVTWDRALFLNLTYWNEAESADVLCDHHIPADVVAHVAWHDVVSRQLARRALPAEMTPMTPPPALGAALFLSESIASAFDLYLVGRLLPTRPECDFVTSQVPLMAECAAEAGLSEAGFSALLEEVVREPERAFEDLRGLLFEAATALVSCPGAVRAQEVLEAFAEHRFAPLLHHYQLSNWVLYARAYARDAAPRDRAAIEVDGALRQAAVSLDWLDQHFIEAAATGAPA